MIVQTFSPSDREWGAFFAKIVFTAIMTPNAAAIRAFIEEDMGPLDEFTFAPYTDLVPWFVKARKGDIVLFVIGGTQTVAHAQAQVDGFTVGLTPDNSDVTNPYYETLAGQMQPLLVFPGLLPIGNLHLAGYSLGGAVALRLFERMKRPGIGIDDVTVTTFGSPRPAGEQFQTTIAAYPDVVRWMMDTDPIPLIPPRLTGNPWLALLNSAPVLNRFARFVQPQGGRSIDILGNVTMQPLPSNASVNQFTSFSAWWLSQSLDQGNPHWIGRYIEALTAGRPAGRVVPPAVVVKPDAVGGVGGGEWNAVNRVNGTAIFQSERVAGRRPVVIPPPTRFRSFHVGRVWGVRFGTNIVAWTGRKRKAVQLTRAGNALLDSLQNTAVVDVPVLQQSVQQYLALASSPSGGFTPVMARRITYP